jgi:PKD repeat protein
VVGTEIAAAALFVDPDHDDTHEAVWDWGDGKESVGVIDPRASGVERDVTGTHVYLEAGSFTVTLTVVDRAGLSDSSSLPIVVVEKAEARVSVAGIDLALALRAV